MYLNELIEKIYDNYPDIENLAVAHNVCSNVHALDEMPLEIIKVVQDQIRKEYGAILELVHGTEEKLDSNIAWHENSSFTDEFDLEFAGEDGYIVVAQVPVERIKFYLPGENEFVVSTGLLACEVFTVKEYFGL